MWYGNLEPVDHYSKYHGSGDECTPCSLPIALTPLTLINNLQGLDFIGVFEGCVGCVVRMCVVCMCVCVWCVHVCSVYVCVLCSVCVHVCSVYVCVCGVHVCSVYVCMCMCVHVCVSRVLMFISSRPLVPTTISY